MRVWNRHAAALLIGTLVCLWLSSTAASADEPAGAAGSGTAILSSDTQLRAFMVFRTPMVLSPGGKLTAALEPVGKDPKPLADFQSTLPPADWFRPEFDDSAWDSQYAPVEIPPGGATGHSPAARHTATVNSVICLRTSFLVTDLAQAGDLKLSLEYVGGVIVRVNGQEVARGHVPAGDVKPDTLAEKYPDDLYCGPDGSFAQYTEKGLQNPEAFNKRYRKLDVAVASKFLCKGANVLAIEIHRSPINEAAINAKRVAVSGMYVVPGIWAYAGLKDLRLSSEKGQGAVANVARPKGSVQVWNVAPFETVDVFSYGQFGKPVQPIVVHAAMNSVFSGRLAVGSDQPISGLKVTVSDLKQSGGSGLLPASAVRVRYAEPAVPQNSWAPPHRFDGLVDTVPASIPVSQARPPRGSVGNRVAGAVASLWFTVQVPKDAKAGQYEGTVTVQAQGLGATAVPLRVTVRGWAMPDPKDFRQHHLIFVCPDAVARHYRVPLWSAKHFELMGKSLALLAEVNSREIPINLGIDFYGTAGNSESMVRWIKQAAPDGTFKHDFTVFDKYLDLVAKHCGKPFPLRLNCWGEMGKDGKNSVVKMVSVVDPATGEIEPMEQPPIGTEESLKFWKPVIDEAVKKLEARGWLDVSGLGHNSYCYPVKPEVVDVAHKLWPNGVWAYTAHNGTLGGRFGGTQKDGAMPVRWSVCVWTEGGLRERGYAALLKPRPSIWCDTARSRHWDNSPLVVIRNLPEEVIMRGMDGAGDFGGDMFPVENPNRKGQYVMLGCGRGTGGPNDAQHAILAPGPDGTVATERFEAFREGTQLAEAILFLEKAVQDKKISGELAQKVNSYLDLRSQTFVRDWYARGSAYMNQWSVAGQFAGDAQLLELAAEAAEAGAH